MSKQIISDAYEKYYAPVSSNTSNHSDGENDEDELSLHLYKHTYSEKQNELEVYLSTSCAHHKTDILQWWKVCILYIIITIY